MDPQAHVADALDAAGRRRHRLALVLAGDRGSSWRLWSSLARGLAGRLPPGGAVALADAGAPPLSRIETVSPSRARDLLGRGIAAAVIDLHGGLEVDALCVAAGCVVGGGMLVLLTPPLAGWAEAPDAIRRRLAPPPFDEHQVGRRLVARLVRSFAEHHIPVIEVPDHGPPSWGASPFPADAPSAPRGITADPRHGSDHPSPADGCLTPDQRAAVEAVVETCGRSRGAVVLTADRGRGKSWALGLAAARLVSSGLRVAVTGPGPEACAEVLRAAARAGVRLDAVDAGAARGGDQDVLLVDEAAALPVPLLRRLEAAAPRLALATTVHGYEGTGQGFAVRFRAVLEERDGGLRQVELRHPIRWGPDDPVERWLHRALVLDAEPAPALAPRGSDPHIRFVAADDLADQEALLRQLFGLLVQSHYRTTPMDLARMLDAPNVRTAAVTVADRVAGAVLVALEGGLDVSTRDGLLRGDFRLRGNMLPETLTCHLAEPDAATLRSWRVLRLAVHPALRGRGLGTATLRWLSERARENGVDLLGAGFAATPELLRFWRRGGMDVVRLAVTRSRISGEHSAVVLRALSGPGAALAERLAGAFLRRLPHVLADALRHLEPPVALEALAGAGAAGRWIPPRMSDDDWRALVACAYGPALYDALVQPAWTVAVAHLTDPRPPVRLDEGQRTLLLTKVIQHQPWERARDAAGIRSIHEAMRRLRETLRPLAAAYGPPSLRDLIASYERGGR